MSNDLNIILQLLVIAGWTCIFVYTFLYKREYVTLFKIYLLFFVCSGFIILNTTIFNITTFKTDWYSMLLYITQILAQLMIILNFHEREIKTDKLRQSEISIDIFKKIADSAPRVICALNYHTNVLVYANKAYEKLYPGEIGKPVNNFFDPIKMAIYQAINDKVYQANGELMTSSEPNADDEMKSFTRFLAVMNNDIVIITMSND